MEWTQGGGLVNRNFLTIELIDAEDGNIYGQWNIDYEFPDQNIRNWQLQSNKRNGKKLCQGFEQLKAEYPEANVELWAIDEYRLGLKPIFRRAWTPVGVQPTVEVNCRNQVVLALWICTSPVWSKLTGGSSPWSILLFLTKCWPTRLNIFGNRRNKHMILVLDRAGWHSSQKLKIPEGLHLE